MACSRAWSETHRRAVIAILFSRGLFEINAYSWSDSATMSVRKRTLELIL